MAKVAVIGFLYRRFAANNLEHTQMGGPRL